ncbi:WSCD family member CG9164-like isoform X2 [Pectinophora gossypiella]|uniref:WSCD family member CG9164-like isoform X2 n=1 Tax=Pectinophora gossypiella TaxID=13191 RepID=UPI00214EDFA2|nr:WSCD family member CG9164-like isoform X2 [Pectinophora gossypiella]
MSRRFLFVVAACVVMLYFSIILFMLNPLHSARLGYPPIPYRNVPIVDWCKPLQRRSPPGDVVGLASFPGSGNTWLRYLLQQATGILTGSVYLDPGLRMHGFPAENVTDGSVLVVKTHETLHTYRNSIFKSTIILIRNPRDAILAEYNRRHMGHIGTAPKSAFKKKIRRKEGDGIEKNKSKTHKETEWERFVASQMTAWESWHKAWLAVFRGPIHIVFYEALVKDTRRVLRDILNFINYNVTESALTCAITHREGIYRRRKKLKDFDPFTDEI